MENVRYIFSSASFVSQKYIVTSCKYKLKGRTFVTNITYIIVKKVKKLQ